MTLVEAYRTLGVDPATAQRDAVTKRYRDLVKRLHPDVRPASERARATEDLQAVNAAFAAVRDSGFPAVAPPAPPAQPKTTAAPGGPSGSTVTPPPPRERSYRAPPPRSGYYEPPPPPNPYATPPFRGAYSAPPPPGNGYRGTPAGNPFGAGPFSAGPRTTSAPGAATGDLAFARRYLRFEGIMHGGSGWYVVVMIFALVRADAALGLVGLVPLLLSLVAWNVSRRARRACWVAIQALWSGQSVGAAAAAQRQLAENASVAVGGYLAAFALALFKLFAR